MPTAYITCPPEAADEIATTLVTEGLAACVNALACTSTYRWEGEVVREPESVLVCKTSAARFDDLRERALEVHPHDVPCVERFDEAEVHPPYADWVESVTAGGPKGNS